MVKAVRFYELGGPEVLKVENVEVGDPGPGEARVRHSFIALNFIDTYFRTGEITLPLTLTSRMARSNSVHCASRIASLISPASAATL